MYVNWNLKQGVRFSWKMYFTLLKPLFSKTKFFVLWLKGIVGAEIELATGVVVLKLLLRQSYLLYKQPVKLSMNS